jgi:AmiR/NasT family two-component response regulator
MASRDIIGQAKGMMIERFNVDAVRAFELLSRLSQNSNIPVAEVAEEMVARGSEPKPLK